jgi:hypothetical protein
MKARNFIYYLQADSLADEWFEELGEEEKGSWDVIEVLFHKKWLKEEELSIKEPAAVENKPHSPPVSSYLVNKTEMAPQFTPNQHNEPPATPQSRTPIENGEKLENHHPTSEFSWNFAIFSSQTLSSTTIKQQSHSSTLVSPEAQPMAATFVQIHQKIEYSPISSPTTPKISAPVISELTDDMPRVYASPQSPNEAFLRPSTPLTSASSSLPPVTREEKSALLRAIFESQPPTESPVPTTNITGLETRPAMCGFMNIHPKLENSPISSKIAPESLISGNSKHLDYSYTSPVSTPIVMALQTRSATSFFIKNPQKSPYFNQNHLELPVFDISNCANNMRSLPTQYILPTKHPCYLSSLYYFW